MRRGSLCSGTLVPSIPVPVVVVVAERPRTIETTLALGGPAPSGGMGRENLKLAIGLDGRRPYSAGLTGWFEDHLLDLRDKLPEGTYLKACITCVRSDYTPAGMNLFGGLACFCGNQEGDRAVDSKENLQKMWKTMTRFIRETSLCPEYERRRHGSGYRG